MTTTDNTQKNYAPFWKKATVTGAVAVTVAGLLFSQNLTNVSASESSEYIAVTDFAAGTTHATIISEDGKAYSRGWNNTGQLGIQAGSKVNVADWTEVSLPEKLVSVKSSDHTVALSESGKLYTWGPNRNGQIGNGNTTASFTPTQICAYTNPGDTVLDIFMGSGSTAVACENTGRNSIGCEKSTVYYPQLIERLNTLNSDPKA